MADLVAGRYRIIEEIGEGGMGEVYLAHDERLKRDVALKRLHVFGANQSQLETFQARFEREAISMAQFIHPYIVPVYDFGSDEDGVYLIMGLMTGGSLKDRMGKPLAPQEVSTLISPIANALAYVHSHNLIHRDVKPHNILFNEHGVPMLSDFGIVKLVENDGGVNLTSTGTGVGTPAYMAPEQMTNKVDARADQYSLGIILYEMLTGKIPFEGETPMMTLFMHRTEPLPDPRLFVPTLSNEICAVLNKVLAKDPEERYADMNEFAKALQEAAQAPPLNVFTTNADFIAKEESSESSAVLNETMVGTPSMFTKKPTKEEDDDSQSIEEFIEAADEFEVEKVDSQKKFAEQKATTQNPVQSATSSNHIQQAYEIPVDLPGAEKPQKRGKKRREKEQVVTGKKKKRKLIRWLFVLGPLFVVLCLTMVLLQQCADLGAALEELAAQAPNQSIEEILQGLADEIQSEITTEDLPLELDGEVVYDIGPQELTFIGDPGIQNLTQKLADQFLVNHPDWEINIAGGGSLIAVTAIGTDKADIGMSRRILTETDWERFPGLYPISIALNPMGVITNSSSDINNLTLDDLRRILSGEEDNWSAFGGPDEPINIYVADFDDDATQAFAFIVMGEDLITEQIQFVATADQVVDAVREDPNGIGILNRMINAEDVHYVAINGVMPDEVSIQDGRYPLIYELLYITHGEPDKKELVFLDFVFGTRGTQIIRDAGLIPIKLEILEE